MALSDQDMGSIVLANIMKNHWYASKVVPYVCADYFANGTEAAIAEVIIDYYSSYGKSPSTKEVVVTLKQSKHINQFDKNVVDSVLGDESYLVNSNDWLVEQTELFIKRRKVSLTFAETYGEFEKGGIGDDFAHKFQLASTFCFDNSIGHSLIRDAGERYEIYTAKEIKYKFYLELLDLITSGGMLPGTLNCLLAGTGVGKSLVMGDIASKNALHGKKVLVISLEMAEVRLAERVEANLMDIDIAEMKKLSKEDFAIKQKLYVDKIREAGGDIYFKQYPTRSAHAGHFRNLLIEFKNKMAMEFDLIVIDYLNICASQNAPRGSNSYTEVKSIAEELRAMAVEFQVPILTATQTNKSGQDTTDLTLDNVSESHGLSATVDMLLAIVTNEDLERAGKLMFIQLKNRYGPLGFFRRFVVGIDRSKMKLFNLAREASDEVSGNTSAEAGSAPAAPLINPSSLPNQQPVLSTDAIQKIMG